VIVRLTGGLGNQLFGYAFGRALSLRRKEPVQFHWARSTWDYALDKYNVNVELIEPKQADRAYNEASFGFDGRALGQPSNVYLSGYWQTEKYFSDYAYFIRKELTLKEPSPASTVGNILAEKQSVFVHFRRGDYTVPSTAAFHGNLELDYYNRAIEYIREKVQNPEFYAFSDDYDWCRTNFPNLKILSLPGGSQHDDLYLMARCAHGIGANSTFSWWANWLGYYSGRVCIVPEKWFKNPEIDTTDLAPSNWTRL